MTDSSENRMQQIWQSQPVEGIAMSVDEIRRRAGKFNRRIVWRNVREYSASLIAAALFVYFCVTAHGTLFRIAFALFIAGLAWAAYQLRRRGSSTNLPDGLDTVTSLRFYRAQLERQRDAVRNVWPWYLAPLVPGFLVLNMADVLALPYPAKLITPALMDVIVAAMFFGIWKLNVRAARCLQRMIDELQAAER